MLYFWASGVEQKMRFDLEALQVRRQMKPGPQNSTISREDLATEMKKFSDRHNAASTRYAQAHAILRFLSLLLSAMIAIAGWFDFTGLGQRLDLTLTSGRARRVPRVECARGARGTRRAPRGERPARWRRRAGSVDQTATG